MIRLVGVLGIRAVGAQGTKVCCDPSGKAKNFVANQASESCDQSLCAFDVRYYRNDDKATNYKTGACSPFSAPRCDLPRRKPAGSRGNTPVSPDDSPLARSRDNSALDPSARA